MEIIKAEQGSPEWLAIRKSHCCASDAAVALGLSKNMRRAELLALRWSGGEPEFSEWERRHLLEKGHEHERQARPMADEIIGEMLYPTTGRELIAGIPLLASFDGITLDDSQSWEHKMYSRELANYINEHNDLPDTHWPQVEHQLLVSGGKRVLFMTSDGTVEPCAHIWYESKPERRRRVIDGWRQFLADLENYQPAPAKAPVVADPVDSLPALFVSVDARVSVRDNLSDFGTRLKAFIEDIKQKPETDQDFANAEAQVKALKKAEDALTGAGEQAIAQVGEVATLRNTIESFRELARTTRLKLEKLVEAEKTNRKNAILCGAQDDLDAHVAELNTLFSKWNTPIVVVSMPKTRGPFAEAAKGLKTLDSMNAKVGAALLEAKSIASMMAERMATNMALLDTLGVTPGQLFPDLDAQVQKDAETFELIARQRFSEHQAAEERRLEAERARIRAEEQARAQQQAQQQEAAPALALAPAPIVAQVAPAAASTAAGESNWNHPPAADTGATINLGALSDRLGFTVTAAFINSLGFEPVPTKGKAVQYRECDFFAICKALSKHIHQVALRHSESTTTANHAA